VERGQPAKVYAARGYAREGNLNGTSSEDGVAASMPIVCVRWLDRCY
jgi:hypothetical protein